MRDIGKNIRQCRMRQHLTQDDLAARIHTTRQTVSNYETGRSRPDIDTLMLLAEVLECETELLLYGEVRPRIDPRGKRRLITGLCLLGGILLVQFVAGLVWTPTDVERYRIHPLTIALLYQLQYARTVLFGWCTVQSLTTLRLFSSRPCRWLHMTLWGLLSLWPLYWIISMATSGQGLSWLEAITRLLLRFHLWPGYFVSAALTFFLGAALCFTKKD